MDHLVVVQCRFQSIRLPGKACYPFYTTSILGFLLNRLERLPNNFHVVLATSKNRSDDIIAHWGQSKSIDVVRGDELNVMSRYLDCLARYDCETVTRVTADNPFTCPDLLSESVDVLISEGLDYIYFMDCPMGVAADTFRRDTLISIGNLSLTIAESEHINMFLLQNRGDYRVKLAGPRDSYSRLHSLTIDTLDDWYKLAFLDLPNRWESTISEIFSEMDSKTMG